MDLPALKTHLANIRSAVFSGSLDQDTVQKNLTAAEKIVNGEITANAPKPAPAPSTAPRAFDFTKPSPASTGTVQPTSHA